MQDSGHTSDVNHPAVVNSSAILANQSKSDVLSRDEYLAQLSQLAMENAVPIALHDKRALSPQKQAEILSLLSDRGFEADLQLQA